MTYTIVSTESHPKTEPKTILSIPAVLPPRAPAAEPSAAATRHRVIHETLRSPSAVRTPPKPIATTAPRRSPPSASASFSSSSSSPSPSPYSQSYPYNSSPIRHSPLSQPPLYAPSRTPSPSSGLGINGTDLIRRVYDGDQDAGVGSGVAEEQYGSLSRRTKSRDGYGNNHGIAISPDNGTRSGVRPIPTPRRSSTRHVSSPLSSYTTSSDIVTQPFTYNPRRSSLNASPILSSSPASASTSPTTKSKSLSRSQPLLGSYPLSLLHSRMSHAHPARQSLEPFTLHLTAVGKGKSCPKELRRPEPLVVPFGATYHDLVVDGEACMPQAPGARMGTSTSAGKGDNRGDGASTSMTMVMTPIPRSSPWVGNIDIEKHFMDSFSGSPQSHSTSTVTGLQWSTSSLAASVSSPSAISTLTRTKPPEISSVSPWSPSPSTAASVCSPPPASDRATIAPTRISSFSSSSSPPSCPPPDIPGYRIAPTGQLQILIRSPSAPIKVFIIPYDLKHLSPGGRMLMREKSYLVSPVPVDGEDNANDEGKARIKTQNKESLKFAIQLQFVCCASSPPLSAPASPSTSSPSCLRSATRSDNFQITGHTKTSFGESRRSRPGSSPRETDQSVQAERLSYYVAKSIRVVFSSPSYMADELRTERHDEFIEPPPPSATTTIPPSERFDQPDSNAYDSRNQGYARSYGGSVLEDEMDLDSYRRRIRRDSLGTAAPAAGRGELSLSFSPGSSSLGRRIEWEMIRERWYAQARARMQAQAQTRSQADSPLHDVDTLYEGTDIKRFQQDGRDHAGTNGVPGRQIQTAAVSHEMPRDDVTSPSFAIDKAARPVIRPTLDRKPSLISATQPSSFQPPLSPTCSDVPDRTEPGTESSTDLRYAPTGTIGHKGAQGEDGDSGSDSSPVPISASYHSVPAPVPMPIISPTPHKLSSTRHGLNHVQGFGQGQGQGHVSSRGTLQISSILPANLSSSVSARSNPRPRSTTPRTASPAPAPVPVLAPGLGPGPLVLNAIGSARQGGSRPTSPLIWSPTSNISRRMTREDGKEEVELSEKLRRMEMTTKSKGDI